MNTIDKIIFDEVKFEPSKEFIAAIEQLLIAEIKMMRDNADFDCKECWYCGVANIGNLCESDWLEMIFGGKEDINRLKKNADVFVEVPF